MVYKIMRITAAIVVTVVVGVVVAAALRSPASPPVVSFDITIYPIEGSDGDFMVELPDGSREVLKKGGARQPATIRDVK